MTRITRSTLVSILSLGFFGVAACGAGKTAGDDAIKGPAAVDTQRILKADDEPGNWMSWGRTYSEARFSPLDQINENNIGQLGLAWYYDFDTMRKIEGTPLVVDGVMYATSAWNITVALDASTGRELWRYDPKVPEGVAKYVCCDVVSRGLAIWEGKIIIATLDGRLIALDAATGTPLWTTFTIDNKEWPYTVTGSPRVFNGKVVIGNGGAEYGVRGYVSAYDVNTGERVWRFYTVPGNPADGFENDAMEMAAKTWSGDWWKLGGGGTVWDAIVYDPDFNRVYFGTGNGSPWPHKLRSEGKGDNLFLASIVAVDADTGKYAWHYQQAPGEQWDYTATQQMVLADLEIDGEKRKVLMQAPKNGFFYVIDRETGRVISADKYVANTWASHIDLKTGRPALLPNADYSGEPRLITPSTTGARSWHPMSYSPRTGLVYFTTLERWEVFEIDPGFTPQAFRMNLGTSAPPSGKNAHLRAELATRSMDGWLSAWDPVKQKEVWRAPYGKGGNGGVLSTAGNLVIHGTADQDFVAYRATDGKKLWSTPIQTVAAAGPISYAVDGEQYIAINAGAAAGFSAAAGRPPARAAGRMLAFKIGGKVELPPLTLVANGVATPVEKPENKEAVARGAAVYGRVCALCHGVDAVSTGAIPDLRFMSAETRRQFHDIVLNGARAAKGMASFADVVSADDADAVYAYLSARAYEDRNK